MSYCVHEDTSCLKDPSLQCVNKIRQIPLFAGKTKDLARWLAECETELEKSKEKENKMYQAMFQSKA